MRKNNHSRQYWAAIGIVGLIGVWKVDFVDAAVTFTGAYTTNPTTWNNKNNWNPNTAVAGGSNTVLFDDTADANLNGASITTGANQAALQLDLGDNSGDTLTSSFSLTDNAILIAKNATGSNPTGLLRNASGTQTINAGLTLGKTQTWNVSGNGSLIVNGVVGDGGLNYGLTKSSGGTLELSGVNTFSGPFILQGGTVIIDNAASLGADTVDPVQLDTATSTSNATLLINNGVTLANSLIAQANTNLKVVTIGGASTLTGSASFTGAITLNQGIQIQATAGQTISATGIISDGSTPGTVAKIDGGTSPDSPRRISTRWQTAGFCSDSTTPAPPCARRRAGRF